MLLLFGGSSPATQAGYISPLAFWMGGAGAIPPGGGTSIPVFVHHYMQQVAM
jgi:hypothetical protein